MINSWTQPFHYLTLIQFLSSFWRAFCHSITITSIILICLLDSKLNELLFIVQVFLRIVPHLTFSLLSSRPPFPSLSLHPFFFLPLFFFSLFICIKDHPWWPQGPTCNPKDQTWFNNTHAKCTTYSTIALVLIPHFLIFISKNMSSELLPLFSLIAP